MKIIDNSPKVLSAPVAKPDFGKGAGGNSGKTFAWAGGAVIGGATPLDEITTTDAVGGQVDSLHTTGKK